MSHVSDFPAVDPASFRDPSGFVFRRDGVLYRQINQRAKNDFELLYSSGLYDELVDAGHLIPHERVDLALAVSRDACAVIRPRQLEFISYPYEWSFSQLQDAALLTLDVQ